MSLRNAFHRFWLWITENVLKLFCIKLWTGTCGRSRPWSYWNLNRICCNQVVSCTRDHAKLQRLLKSHWCLVCWMYFSRNVIKQAFVSRKTLYPLFLFIMCKLPISINLFIYLLCKSGEETWKIGTMLIHSWLSQLEFMQG